MPSVPTGPRVTASASAASNTLEHQYSISWLGLTHSVTTKGKVGERSKTILRDISGHCSQGQMLALLGPSGSGKTTLLDLLGDRVSTGCTSGRILIGQHERDSASSRKLISYVAQEDALLTCFTVKETL